jgi:hypothetical protein
MSQLEILEGHKASFKQHKDLIGFDANHTFNSARKEHCKSSF